MANGRRVKVKANLQGDIDRDEQRVLRSSSRRGID